MYPTIHTICIAVDNLGKETPPDATSFVHQSVPVDPLFNNVRAMLYVAVPAVLLELVKDGRLSQDRATLWSAVAIAALSPRWRRSSRLPDGEPTCPGC